MQGDLFLDSVHFIIKDELLHNCVIVIETGEQFDKVMK